MQYSKILISLLALFLVAFVTVTPSASAVDVAVGETGEITLSTDAEDNTTEEDNSILGSLKSAFGSIINAFVGMITIPFTVTVDIFTSWGETLGTWYGPLLGGVVIFGLYLLIRFAFQTDKFFDLFS